MEIKITGLNKFIKRIDPERFSQIKNKALFIWSEILKWKLQEATPVDTSILRQSYRIQEKNNKVVVYNTKKYWLYIHDGTKPHWTSVKNVRKWAQRHGVNPYAVQRAIARKGTKWKKWIPKVLNKSWKAILNKIEKFISKNLENV